MAILPKNESLVILYENESFIVYKEWEDATLVDKRSKKKVEMGSHYGDPTCAIIPKSNNWCIVGGDGLYVWKRDSGEVVSVFSEEISHVMRLKLVSEDEVLFLIDPWSSKSAIWSFNIPSMTYKKVQDFLTYREKPFTEDIDW